MAGFSEGYYSEGNRLSKTTSSMWTSGKFLLDPELRARRVVNLSQNSDVHFCKAFWFLAESELMCSVPSMIGTAIKVNKIVTIPPEPLKLLNSAGDGFVDIPIPFSHLGPGPVTARLLSYNLRRGMVRLCKDSHSEGILISSNWFSDGRKKSPMQFNTATVQGINNPLPRWWIRCSKLKIPWALLERLGIRFKCPNTVNWLQPGASCTLSTCLGGSLLCLLLGTQQLWISRNHWFVLTFLTEILS